jgi:hypothetical protein
MSQDDMSQEFHLSDQELLMAVDGELSDHAAERVQSHLAACWACRARKQEIETTIGEFMRFQRESFNHRFPSPEGPRALLRAQMAQLASVQANPWASWFRFISQRLSWAAVAGVLILAGVTYLGFRTWQQSSARLIAVTTPNPALTPGATVLVDQREICMETGVKNKDVPVALRKRVFDEYGIRSADPRAYEVDYLITPALGGADDIHNLWPESNRAAVWNAEVKDSLEDHLRDLVCDGRLDLATAQREIATNWIEAYKKYFHTDRPVTGLRN